MDSSTPELVPLPSPDIVASAMESKPFLNGGSAENNPQESAKLHSEKGRGRGSDRLRGGRGEGARHKRSDMGRGEWARQTGDRRSRNEEGTTKRRKFNEQDSGRKPVYAVEFSREEIEGDERRPKRKVAVMIGYSGSGYKGMQLNDKEKTIEGDLFRAFVAAGAVSKANANDPKKSALVRCARTDKGVHAAGNIISMKLIVEDENIVQKINEHLSPQIRVWGIERTKASFSAYQLCDSRIYEYLIPTHCFLPPHPNSFLGMKLVQLADEAGDREGYEKRQEEVAGFWAESEAKYVKPILDDLEPSLRLLMQKALFDDSDTGSLSWDLESEALEQERTKLEALTEHSQAHADGVANTTISPNLSEIFDKTDSETTLTEGMNTSTQLELGVPVPQRELSPLNRAVRDLKAAYIASKRAYRISTTRIDRIRSALTRYLGTHSYHNYTVKKSFRDASAKRVIKSFVVNSTPIIINNTEWLSLKVHGQSFMMHQIRKMVSMVALVVRCGCHEGRFQDSYGPERMIIPKAPGLGLLLERPVFDTYNERIKGQADRNPVGFESYETEMEEFKQREIYERIFREEERDNSFHVIFSNIDNLKGTHMLYLSSMGIAASRQTTTADSTASQIVAKVDVESSEDEEHPEDG